MSASFDQFDDEVRSRLDIVEIVRDAGVALKQRGRLYEACCPFHSEKTPSFKVNPDRGTWHCFGACQQGGDAFSFLMKRDGIGFWQAKVTLARSLNIAVPARGDAAQSDRREAARGLLDLAALFYHHRLVAAPQGKAAEYLASRRFGPAEIETWMLGEAGRGNELLAHLTKMGADLPLALEIGLLKEKDGKLSDFFWDRLMIPFIDAGQVSYLTGRSLSQSKQYKYLHLPTSPWFKKPVYNGAARGKTLLIVEGPVDVWAAQALGGTDVAAVALMGLDVHNSTLERALRGRDRVLIATDADAAGQSKVGALALRVGVGLAQRLTWPAKDCAEWLEGGATAEQFDALLASAPLWLDEQLATLAASDKAEKPDRMRAVVEAIATMPAIEGDMKMVDARAALKGSGVLPSTLDAALKSARKAFGTLSPGAEPSDESAPKAKRGKGGAQPPSDPPAANGATASGAEVPFYQIVGGEMVYGDKMTKITRFGHAKYTEMVYVDDGEEKGLQLTLQVRLNSGEVHEVRVPAEETADAGKVKARIKSVVGPKLQLEPFGGAHLLAAMDAISQADIVTRREIARTGWIDFEGRLVYCTPRGTVGDLPEGVAVKLPINDLGRYGVADGSDAEFLQGLDAVLNGLLKSFDLRITIPMLAFALFPPLHRWLPTARKFMFHFIGDTGSLKTETAIALNALYGDMVGKPPVIGWQSTVNALEGMLFWLPDAMAVVDDYKPISIKSWDFVALVQRYADGNARQRLTRNAELQSRRTMRGYILSTGQDLPEGEASALARIVSRRFPQRPEGAAYNAPLGLAQRKAKFLPVVMARWCAWLRDNAEKLALDSKFVLAQTNYGNLAQQAVPEAANVPRISNNVAVLHTVWATFLEFVQEQSMKFWDADIFDGLDLPTFDAIGRELIVDQAKQVANEKPTEIFLQRLQAGLESGRLEAVSLTKGGAENAGGDRFVGFYDVDGFYMLSAAFQAASKWMRESGQPFGFTESELKRLLVDEGLLEMGAGRSPTKLVRVGTRGATQVRRVMHLRKGLITVAVSGETAQAIQEAADAE